MFERFTDRARKAVVLADREAREMRHAEISPVHLLLGLASEECGGVAYEALSAFGMTVPPRDLARRLFPPGETAPARHIPFSRAGKTAIDCALREALLLGCNYVGTEHLLLGVLRAGMFDAALLLDEARISMVGVRAKVLALLNGYAEAERAALVVCGQPYCGQPIRQCEFPGAACGYSGWVHISGGQHACVGDDLDATYALRVATPAVSAPGPLAPGEAVMRPDSPMTDPATHAAILRAIIDPGSIVARMPGESVSHWQTRAVTTSAAPLIRHNECREIAAALNSAAAGKREYAGRPGTGAAVRVTLLAAAAAHQATAAIIADVPRTVNHATPIGDPR